MSDTTPLRPHDPRHLGRYEVVARLGGGGMGVVFLARTPGHARVAIKVIHADLAHDRQFLARFRREVEATRRVDCVGTARVLDFDLEASPPYLVTEYVDGRTLQDRVSMGGPLRPDELYGLGAGLAETLATMHAAGVIHRDLKPANVILTDSGPKVIDFGIAHAIGETSLTATGLVVGSPGWLAPEQVGGESETPATDIFAWGCVMAFAATGEAPFGQGRPEVYVSRLLTQIPSLAGVSPELQPLLNHVLEKDPQQRPNATQVLASLATHSPDRTGIPTPTFPAPTIQARWSPPVVVQDAETTFATTSRRRARPRIAAGSALAALVIASVAILLLRHGGARATATSPSPTTSPQASPESSIPSSAPPAGLPAFTPAADNVFRTEVWGNDKVPFGPPANTSYLDSPVTRRNGSGLSLLVPSGWAVANESIPSDHSDFLYYDPANTAARIEISGSGCVGCLTSTDNRADPTRVLPQGTISSFVYDHGIRAGFQEAPADGYPINGVVAIMGSRDQPTGYWVLRLALPPGDSALATRILDSIAL